MNGCIKCGQCIQACMYDLEDFPGPRRLAVEYPRINETSDKAYLCTTCGRCESVCPSQLSLTQAVIKMREMIYPSVNEGHRKVLELAEKTNHSIEPKDYSAPETGRTLFFPGCVGKGRLAARPEEIIKLLTAAGAEPYIPKNTVCCGSPLSKMGADEEAERLVDMNYEILSDAENIVTVCPGCTMMINAHYGINVLHILEFLKDSKLNYAGGDDIKVYLHSPCHLLRGVGPHVMDAAREILNSIPGVTILDCGSEEICCGGGGGVLAAHPDRAFAAADAKAKDAQDAGADLILAPCPFCAVNLRRPKRVKTMEFSEFLAARLSL